MIIRNSYLAMIAGIILSGSVFSCKKDELVAQTSSTFTITNAIAGVPTSYSLYARFNYGQKPTLFVNAPMIPVDNTLLFNGYSGGLPMAFSPKTDTTKVLYPQTLNIQNGNIYSLFLMGTESDPDYLFQQEDIPPHYVPTDSVVGVRFINLSKGSAPITVNIKGTPEQLIAGPIAYKASTAYRPYPMGRTAVPSQSYGFEIRDQATGNLITSYTLASIGTLQSKNISLVLKGIPKGMGTSTQRAIVVNPK
jgi:hypothetical protein